MFCYHNKRNKCILLSPSIGECNELHIWIKCICNSYFIDIDCIYLCINNASLNYVAIFWHKIFNTSNILYNFLNYAFFNALLETNFFITVFKNYK